MSTDIMQKYWGGKIRLEIGDNNLEISTGEYFIDIGYIPNPYIPVLILNKDKRIQIKGTDRVIAKGNGYIEVTHLNSSREGFILYIVDGIVSSECTDVFLGKPEIDSYKTDDSDWSTIVELAKEEEKSNLTKEVKNLKKCMNEMLYIFTEHIDLVKDKDKWLYTMADKIEYNDREESFKRKVLALEEKLKMKGE